MELMTEEKKGFRKTDYGVIPEDWDLKDLSEIGSFSKGKGIRKSEVKNEGIPCIRYGELYTRHHDLIHEFYSFIDENVAKQSRKLYKGDILFAGSGETKKEIGKSVAFNLDVEAYAGGDIVILSPSEVDSKFLGYALNSEIANEQKYQRAQGDAVVHIYSSSLSNLKIPLPPTLIEQQAIASALSDVDELIRSLDGLIQKKQAIKKGTMQQLLSGKKRLPGFDGEWEEVKSGEVVEYINGRAYSKHEWENTGTPVVRLQNLTGSGESYYYSTLNLPEKNYMYEGDLIFMWSASFGPYIWNGPKAIYHYHIWKIDCNEDKIDKMFYYHKLVRLTEELKQTTSGSTMLHLTKAGMEKFKLNLPPLEEQKAIAQILCDMDRELQTLCEKREKYVQIKQGMMQELLTGRTRLVEPKSKQFHAAETKSKRSWAYEEAVIISTLIDRFRTERFFLSRFRYVKYSYLLKRYKEMEVSDYLKKAAGPYNPQTRYGGPERIAQSKNYIIPTTSGKYKGFTPGDNVEEAVGYFEKWYGTAVLDWLEQFRFTINEELELLTTVDLAIQDLKEAGSNVSLPTVKRLISDNDEWRPKLKRKVFSDERIEAAIEKVNQLF